MAALDDYSFDVMLEYWDEQDRYGTPSPVNVFYVDHDPATAARAHPNAHVVKMILETGQLLSAAWHVLAPDAVEQVIGSLDPLFNYEQGNKLLGPGYCYHLGNQRIYAPSHLNHPCAVWARETTGNYRWLWRLGMELLAEYTYRYGRTHASTAVLRTLERPPGATPQGPQNEPPTAMPDAFVEANSAGEVDAVASYRAYYLGTKVALLRYKKRPPPAWAAHVAIFTEE